MNHTAFSPATCWKCEGSGVYNRSICRSASDETLRELGRISRIRTYSKGEGIITEGDESSLVGNVVEGIVKLANTSSNGEQQIVGLLYPSDFFGRVYADQVRFSYEAATDVTLCCVDRHAFETFLERHPDLEHELLLTTLDELDAVREWAAMMSCHTTMERLASFLFILSKRSGAQHCLHRDAVDHPLIMLPIGRRDIAAYLGTTPETLSRNLQTLVRADVIRPLDTNRFELVDEAGLVARTGESRADLEEMSGVKYARSL